MEGKGMNYREDDSTNEEGRERERERERARERERDRYKVRETERLLSWIRCYDDRTSISRPDRDSHHRQTDGPTSHTQNHPLELKVQPSRRLGVCCTAAKSVALPGVLKGTIPSSDCNLSRKLYICTVTI